MEQIYIDTAKILKAISDPKRLHIVDMLSCRELCVCKILEAFHITQPTLSHDMRVLIEAGIVNDRRELSSFSAFLWSNVGMDKFTGLFNKYVCR